MAICKNIFFNFKKIAKKLDITVCCIVIWKYFCFFTFQLYVLTENVEILGLRRFEGELI